ncbi:hypothetical protein SOM55_00480 [Pseudomonas coleopterorum]|uniref:hypothetical protein n=1 Tax=Pseudomonas coleopterorum TaxID=1605838 RepID=UPI002A6B1E00|nr:hypothetical protein [Pseudomonas coleopterorum]MDY1045278.1 hypothetical protein [Pseudomonas coleopterorum]
MAILRHLNLQSQQRGQDVPLENVQLAWISAEMTRLEALFSADKLIRDQYAALTSASASKTHPWLPTQFLYLPLPWRHGCQVVWETGDP